MAIKYSYTLSDITSYASEKFPLAFDIIADPQVYELELRSFNNSTLGSFDGHFLRVGFWESEDSVCSAWVYSNGTDLIYLIERPGQPLTHVSRDKRISERSLRGPFSYIPTREQSQIHEGDNERYMHASGNRLFSLLVHVAFLVAGKTYRIQNMERVNLLEKIEHLCIHLYANKVAGQSVAVGPFRTHDKRVEEQVPEVDSQISQPGLRSVFGGCKRIIEDSFLDHPALKIRKHSRNALVHSETTLPSTSTEKPGQPAAQLASTFEILFQQFKTEVENFWAQEKREFQHTIYDLRSELAKEQAKVQEAEKRTSDLQKKAEDLQNMSSDWQDKYERLKDKLAGLMGDD